MHPYLPSQRIKGGLKLRFTDHRDLDFHKTFGTTTFNPQELPDKYYADAGLTMPDQNRDGYPMGCTGYAQTDLCTDQDEIVYDAGELYENTPPYDRGGRELRKSLKVLVDRGPRDKQGNLGEKRTAFYNIRASGILDWFDAIRVALWITQDEKRSASIGIPWFPEFHSPDDDGILPEPTQFSWARAEGHDAKVAGWKTIDGVPYLYVKSWQGPGYGRGGWCYMSRELANKIFDMYYTEAFTVTKKQGVKQTIDMPAVERLVSYIQLLLRRLHVI